MRKALLITILTLMSCLHLGAQGVSFDSYEWDFSAIREADGPVSHVFVMRNDSKAPVKIARAIPGCSCISAGFQSGEVAPGHYAEVEVFFSPTASAGKVYRTIELVDARGKGLGTLSIQADVTPSDESIQVRYPRTVTDMLYISKVDIPFGYLAPGASLPKVIYLANASERPMTVAIDVEGSSLLDVTCPSMIGAGDEVPVLLRYTMPQEYGSYSDIVRFTVDGKSAKVPVTTSAICLDRAAPSAGAPTVALATSSIQMTKGFFSKTYSGEVVITNRGKSSLTIYKVEMPAMIMSDLQDDTVIEVDETAKFKVRTTSEGEYRANIFTDDPSRPYLQLILKSR